MKIANKQGKDRVLGVLVYFHWSRISEIVDKKTTNYEDPLYYGSNLLVWRWPHKGIFLTYFARFSRFVVRKLVAVAFFKDFREIGLISITLRSRLQKKLNRIKVSVFTMCTELKFIQRVSPFWQVKFVYGGSILNLSNFRYCLKKWSLLKNCSKSTWKFSASIMFLPVLSS